MYQKALYWSLGTAEVAIALARAYPKAPLAQSTISLLVNRPNLSLSLVQLHCGAGTIIGTIMVLTGTWIQRRCYATLGRFFTFELSIRNDHRLITSGPYSIVRHPSYAGIILVGIGAALVHGSAGSWLVECSGLFPNGAHGKGLLAYWAIQLGVAFIGIVKRINREDAMLKRTFGKQWEDWVRAVPNRLVPGLY